MARCPECPQSQRIPGGVATRLSRAFSLSQSAALFAIAISLISVLLLGHIGSHVDLTSERRGHQAKPAMTGGIPAKSKRPLRGRSREARIDIPAADYYG